MTRSSLPDRVTINWLAECVGMHPSTVKRRTTGLERDTAGKLKRVQAFEAVFISAVETKDGRITTPEAVRQLTVEKALQVRLQNEITRKERIPIDDVLEVTGQVFQSMAAIIKSKRDKMLTEEVINELFAELRSFPDRLNWPGVKLTDLAQ
jgi:DNA-binding Lrp family transcriptional regulator